MSILIKGMDMPKRCVECEWHEYYGGDYDWVHACRRTGTMPIENAETERANDCPLVEIPEPHGDLIDRSMLDPDSEYEDGDFWAVSVAQIELMPTVIEAERSENHDD